MAGDWIKIQHSLPTKPEVFGIARRVGQNRQPTSERVGQRRAEIVGYLVIFWAWLDEITATGEEISLHCSEIDEIVGCPGFAQALRDEGWLTGREGSLQIPNYERHNGTSAKARALESEAKRLRRLSDNNPESEPGKLPATASENCPTKSASNVGPDERRREETRGDPSASKSVRPNGSRSDLTPEDFQQPGEEPFDTSRVDWEHVVSMAETVARKIPPQNDRDRRQWLKYAVLADRVFDEHWIVDSMEAVLRSKGSKKSKQAHFVAVLKSKAAKEGTDEDTFNAMVRRIEIPKEIWTMEGVTA